MNYINSCDAKIELTSEQQVVAAIYPYKVSPYYASLIKKVGDPIWRQSIPDVEELNDMEQESDPLSEKELSPVPGLIHRYPDRVVLLVSNRCPVYCRFCMRKRHVGNGEEPLITAESMEAAAQYIEANPEINDVILSGGDPLMLNDSSLFNILKRLRKILTLSIIRIGTRTPVTLPERITPKLVEMLRQFHPIYINTHFNHPNEITQQSTEACKLLADAGIPLGNQTVLLKGVNDDLETMRKLFKALLAIRVKPYYLHQMDLVRGTAHFRTKVSKGLELMRGIRGHISGLAVPHYVIDLPGGKGKVPILPENFHRVGELLHLKTYNGEVVEYLDVL